MESRTEELEHRGIRKEDSCSLIKKRCCFFLCLWSTACPSSTSVHLTAVWTLIGIKDIFFRYEAAGEMFVGKTASGLPIEHVEI
jgi:hypothetical protein